MECLLCKSPQLAVIDSFKVSDLIKSYRSIAANYPLHQEMQGVTTIEVMCCNSCDYRFYNPVLSGSDKFYEFLQTYDWYYSKNKPEFNFAKTHIKPSDAVLEIGAGSGYFAANLTCASYFGLEYNDKSIAEAAAKGIKLERKSIEDLALAQPETYDVVCAFQVLEHVPQPAQFMKAAVAAAKKGGKIIMAIPSADSYAAHFPNHALNLPPHHVSLWTDKNLSNMAELFGLTLVEIWHEPCNKAQYQLMLYAIWIEKLNKLFGLKERFIAMGFAHKLVQYIAHKLSVWQTPANVETFQARGQSVTAVYLKK
ncbi:MAG: class I SAM-dependent methyltransferase [Bacteroidetes bacterium]|nr:class I SAM-dependent methyltransferase [Bacteroidota bacterium]